MNLWLPIITVIGMYNGIPVEYSYPLSSQLHYNRENCVEEAVIAFDEFASALKEAGIKSLNLKAFCINLEDAAQI